MLSSRIISVGDFVLNSKMMKPLWKNCSDHMFPKSKVHNFMKSVSYYTSGSRRRIHCAQICAKSCHLGGSSGLMPLRYVNKQQQSFLFPNTQITSSVKSFGTSRSFNDAASSPESSIKKDESEGPFPSVTLTRIVWPADTQMLGMIHGGILLGLIEEAGSIAATKYCNRYLDPSDSKRTGPVVAALASVEQTDFLHPMKLGAMIELQALVTYTSQRSLEVVVNVYGTDALQPTSRKLTNRSVLWYVPINTADPDVKVKIQPLPPIDLTAHARSHASYIERKLLRENISSRASLKTTCLKTFSLPGIPDSSVSSSYIIHPIHCGGTVTPSGCGNVSDNSCWQICKGGVLLRWMDDITGAYVMSHAGTACVTASIDSAEFYSMIPVGSYVTVVVRPVFSSKRTVDMLATAYVEDFTTKHVEYKRVAEAFYTFALYGKDNKSDRVELIPPVIEANNEEDQKMFEARKKRYLTRKAKAEAAKKSKQ